MQPFARLRPAVRNVQSTCIRCRFYASATPSTSAPGASPLLLKLREDLKTSMRAKDTARLNVLRGILAEVTNAAKTNTPIQSDMQLLSLLRKRSNAAEQAAKEFEDAGRQDLKDKEDKYIEILNGYAGNVDTVGEQEIRNIVVQAVTILKDTKGDKINAGEVMKSLLAPGGAFDGKPVEKAAVAKIVKEVLAN